MALGLWEEIGYCECGAEVHTVTASVRNSFKRPCPHCGKPAEYRFAMTRTTWTGTWWKPWTWLCFKHEYRYPNGKPWPPEKVEAHENAT